MVALIKQHYPNVDITITTSNNNSSIKIKNMPNRTTVRAEICSKKLGIYAEANEDTKPLAIQYSSQRFLKKLYKNKFKTWVELNNFFKKTSRGNYLKDII